MKVLLHLAFLIHFYKKSRCILDVLSNDLHLITQQKIQNSNAHINEHKLHIKCFKSVFYIDNLYRLDN